MEKFKVVHIYWDIVINHDLIVQQYFEEVPGHTDPIMAASNSVDLSDMEINL